MLRKEESFGMFGNRVLRRILEPRVDEVPGD
jgi:hypothetical protein